MPGGDAGRFTSLRADHLFRPIIAALRATSEWAHPAWIVGRALATIAQGYRQTSDLTLFARLDALVENDQLEWRESDQAIHGYEVRRLCRA
ncbi:DUF3658 domain-containing protein [Sphingomonas sanguinis]|uniref:DUF3658 domain-containing protein n=1 Tax=Sphingomonas sanguinis TaxID=33051 RepID=UPI00128F8AD6